MKCRLVDLTWQSCSQTHSICGYQYKTSPKLRLFKIPAWMAERFMTELLAIDGCWGQEKSGVQAGYDNNTLSYFFLREEDMKVEGAHNKS